jgi:hypothetical protein
VETAPELKELVLRLYEAVSRGDGAAIEGLLSRERGLVFIGTDPNEWFEDSASVRTMLEAQAGAGVTVVPGEIGAYREGSVGWIADRGVFKLPDGGEVPFRITAVFRREDGEWKLIQEHASIGVGNEEAIGTELTASA